MTEWAAAMTNPVITRLEETHYRKVVSVQGISPAIFRSRWEHFRQELESKGRVAILIDGGSRNRARGVIYEALSTWLQGNQQISSGESSSERLFDYLTMVMDMDSHHENACEQAQLVTDGSLRLMEGLSAEGPAVLVVLEPELLSQVERDILKAACNQFVVDPLAEIDPLAAWSADIGLVCVGAWSDCREEIVEIVQLEEEGAGQVRRFLSEERVVARLLETTQGDPQRLEAIFEGLPQSVVHLWSRRFAELEGGDRGLLECLAVADVALEVSFLDRLGQESVVAPIRRLCDEGFLIRRMRQGAVEVELATAEMRRSILEDLGPERREVIHLRLASTALESGGKDAAFIARHALAGGNREVGLRFGLSAARQLLRRGQLEAADALLSNLRSLTGVEKKEFEVILELSLRSAEAQGDWRQALAMAGRLKPFRKDTEDRRRLERRIAEYLIKIGRFQLAQSRLEAAMACEDLGEKCWERAQIMVGLAEISYFRGDHQCAESWAARAQEIIDGEKDLPAQAGVTNKALSVLGKVALFQGKLTQARRYFEECAAQARKAGLSVDEAKAEANLGVVAVQQRRYDEAARRLERALEGAELPGGLSRLNCWLNLGIVYQRTGDFGQALKFYRLAIRAGKSGGDDVAYQVAAHNLATLYQDMGAFEEAQALVDQLLSRRDDRFTKRWAAMVSAQNLLDRAEFGPAIEALGLAEEELNGEGHLYGMEMRLRRAGAHLALGQVAEAREILESFEDDGFASAQLQRMYDYYELAVSAREDSGHVDGETWTGLIDDLESLGQFRDAMEARLVYVGLLLEVEEKGAQLILERAVEDLRQRADKVPERFRRQFFAIPVHQQLIRTFGEVGGEFSAEEWGDVIADEAAAGAGGVVEADENELSTLQDPAYLRWRARYSNVVGEDPRLLQIFRFVDRVAPGDTSVLLAGESGTGKELVAEAIHQQSQRRDRPFVKVNCAAFVEELLLSELFGHEKGAFTGAVDKRAGRFELADGGTIFLDEIGDIPPKTQVALLRVLQEGEFERVGGTVTQSVDVRVVAATNRDLGAMVREGLFRLDLYYRLKGFLIEVPPLRERREDIPRLLSHFAKAFSPADSAPAFDEETVQFLARYRWPGNVREMENFVRSVLLFAEGDAITMEEVGQFREFFSQADIDESLPAIDAKVVMAEILASEEVETTWISADDSEEALVEEIVSDELSLAEMKKRLEIKCIKRALEKSGGNITQAAQILQMKRPRLSQIVNSTPELLEIKDKLVG